MINDHYLNHSFSMNPVVSPVSLLKRIVPPLTSKLHKGQLGKIGVIGGCLEYTGAPFYAGIAAQRCVRNAEMHSLCRELTW